jgi:hypothetical protein
MYIVYSPSKTGTTSIFKLLTDNSKFPALQIHGEMMNIGCHDKKNSSFTNYIMEHFSIYVKDPIEFDDTINYGSKYISYGIYFNGDYEQLYKFLKYIKGYSTKIITCYRDPVYRSISALLHWLDRDALDRHLQVTDGGPINHYPYSLILNEEKLTAEKCLEIYYKIFDQSLMYEYLCVLFNIKMHYGIHLYLKKNESFNIKNSEGCNLFYYRLDKIDEIKDEIYNFFDINKDYSYPKERDYTKRKNYLINPDIVKNYILNNISYEFLKNNITIHMVEL